MAKTAKSQKRGNFGIIVSGGPAPGINGVISAATIEAVNRGFRVKGLNNGFRGISQGEKDAVIDLSIPDVTAIYNRGGSILGTSRFNPFGNRETKQRFLQGLSSSNIDKLIVIGGDGSAYLSYQISKQCPELKICHVPKTIDNDLILPNKQPSFGFETARFAGTQILETLMVDAKTTRRWFLVTSMGRRAGFLALGLGLAAGATLTLIPEEFHTSITPEDVAGIIFGSYKRRAQEGKHYGVAVVAEGLLDCFDPQSSSELRDNPRDELGRIKYSQIELGDVILPSFKRLAKREGFSDVRVFTKNIGYELRCHDPISFDIEYTKFLGYGAVKHILDGYSGIMVTRDFDKLGFELLEDMVTPDDTIRARRVNLNSDLYKVARSFMIRD